MSRNRLRRNKPMKSCHYRRQSRHSTGVLSGDCVRQGLASLNSVPCGELLPTHFKTTSYDTPQNSHVASIPIRTSDERDCGLASPTHLRRRVLLYSRSERMVAIGERGSRRAGSTAACQKSGIEPRGHGNLSHFGLPSHPLLQPLLIPPGRGPCLH